MCAQICLDNRCVDLSVYGAKEECAKKCNNNGVSEGFEIICSCFQLKSSGPESEFKCLTRVYIDFDL